MKIYIEIDSIYGGISFRDNTDVWHLTSDLDFETLMNIILTPNQYMLSMDTDFCGYISIKRYKAAKEYYESVKN